MKQTARVLGDPARPVNIRTASCTPTVASGSAVLTRDQRVAVARLHALLELLPTALDKELASAGITSFEFTRLEALHEADHHRLRLSALAARTNATFARLSLERKHLVVRAPCEEDGRATNAILTDAGETVFLESTGLYADAVQRMVLDGLDDAGVDQLATLTYGILSRLDPDRRLTVTAGGPDQRVCAAGPGESTDADATCAADPVPAR
ncbi:MarR family winged helix-turn-helix transcriptional regulator [Microbacterium deminutum]|uniref:MarR family winged helix-turn-helix transcriptional regulator n=1 Tax=Microbacterium deminutum TaxID=344164 RepID=UPI0031CE5F5E